MSGDCHHSTFAYCINPQNDSLGPGVAAHNQGYFTTTNIDAVMILAYFIFSQSQRSTNRQRGVSRCRKKTDKIGTLRLTQADQLNGPAAHLEGF